jgi:competence protein ComEC
VRVVGLLPAIPLIAGAVCGIASPVEAHPCVWVLLCVYAAVLAAWWSGRDRACALALTAAFLAAGTALGASARSRALDTPLRAVLDEAIGGVRIESLGPEGDHDPVLLRAVLLEDAAVFEDYASLRAEALTLAETPVSGGVTISVSGEAFRDRVSEWRAGRTIEAPVTFRRPARYLNEGVADFERDLALGGTTLLGSIKSGLLVDVVAPGNAIEEWAGRVRARVRRAVNRWVSTRDPLSGALVTAILIGDRAGLPIEVRDRLQRAGTYHVIAISGGNIAILAGLGLLVLALAGIRGRPAALMAAAGVCLYAVVVTAGPSVWRATLMAVIYLASKAIDHRTPPWQAMAVAAALMAVLDPLDVRNAGFILTFGATAALLESARRFSRSRWLTTALAASIAVEAVLLPVSAQVFSRVTLAGLVLNLAAVPLMGVVQIAGMAVAAVPSLDTLASPAGWLAHVAATALVSSARLLDVTPWLSLRVPPPGIALLAVYYGALALAAFGGRRTRWRCGAAMVLAVSLTLIVTGWRPPSPRSPAPDLRLTLFDVGQGEAMLLELPRGPRLLVDSGGVPFGEAVDIGARVVAPALWARGVRSLDGLLITHGDPDHLGGAGVVTEVFRPRWLWEGIVVPAHEPMAVVRAAVRAAGGRVETLRTGGERAFGEARIRVLHPPAPDWERPRVRNDDSVVVEVRYRDVAIVLTGDISADIEREILPRLSPARVRILKVAHHGSRTSSSIQLLESWRPQFALISAGRGNSFGHPTPEVLRRLASIGATILRTDRDGQIAVETDGRTVRATRYFEGRK